MCWACRWPAGIEDEASTLQRRCTWRQLRKQGEEREDLKASSPAAVTLPKLCTKRAVEDSLHVPDPETKRDVMQGLQKTLTSEFKEGRQKMS